MCNQRILAVLIMLCISYFFFAFCLSQIGLIWSYKAAMNHTEEDALFFKHRIVKRTRTRVPRILQLCETADITFGAHRILADASKNKRRTCVYWAHSQPIPTGKQVLVEGRKQHYDLTLISPCRANPPIRSHTCNWSHVILRLLLINPEMTPGSQYVLVDGFIVNGYTMKPEIRV